MKTSIVLVLASVLSISSGLANPARMGADLLRDARCLHNLEILRSGSGKSAQYIYLIHDKTGPNYELLKSAHDLLGTFEYRGLQQSPDLAGIAKKIAKYKPTHEMSTSELATKIDHIPNPAQPSEKIRAKNVFLDTSEFFLTKLSRFHEQVSAIGLGVDVTLAYRMLDRPHLLSQIWDGTAPFPYYIAFVIALLLLAHTALYWTDISLGEALSRYDKEPWFKYVFPMYYGQTKLPAIAAANEIRRLLLANPQMDSVLVIANEHSAPVLIELLESEHGAVVETEKFLNVHDSDLCRN